MNPADQGHFNTMLTSFSQLSTPRSKCLALEGLMNNMSHQEIRNVQKYVKDIYYRTDVFTKLPLELSQRIAQFMGLTQAIRARRVSKSWLNILTSSQTTQCLLQPWYGVDGSTLRVPDGLSQNAVSSLKAENIWAYQSGTAFDQLTVQRPISLHGPISNHVAYSTGKVAWIDTNTATIHVLSLEDAGGSLTKEGDGEALSHLALSSSIIAVTTFTGECRISEFANGLEHRFQLSDPNVEKLVVAEETLGVLHRPLTPKDMRASVTTWTLADPTPLHFAFSLHRLPKQAVRPSDLKIMLDKSGRSVLVFERVTQANVVYFTRFSLEGRVEASGTLGIPSIEGFDKHSEESTPTDVNGWVTVWSYSKSARDIKMLRVQWGLHHHVLRLKEDSFMNMLGQVLDTTNVFFWKNIAYCRTRPSRRHGHSSIHIIDFNNTILTPILIGDGLVCPFDPYGLENSHFPSHGRRMISLFFGDERFLINACRVGFYVWAFDRNHGMTQTDAEYRSKREEAKKNKDHPWRMLWAGW